LASFKFMFLKVQSGFLILLVGTTIILLSGCAETALVAHTAKRIKEFNSDIVSKGYYKVGTPYKIKSVWYYPQIDFEYDETGIGSWYGPNFHQKLTANGEVFDQNSLTAAHRTLPMPSIVRVTNLENGRALIVRINDRGPFAHGRIIDLSRRSSQLLGFKKQGTAKMRVEILPAETRKEIAKIKGGYTAVIPPIVNNAPTPNAVPVTIVSVKTLAVIPGDQLQKSKTTNKRKTTSIIKKSAIDLTRISSKTGVQQRDIKHSDIYVQAAAFSEEGRAIKLKHKISNIGQTNIYKAVISGRLYYRVRIGPFSNVKAADNALNSLIKNGFPGARVVVAVRDD
jgi:rare lipoprotein A